MPERLGEIRAMARNSILEKCLQIVAQTSGSSEQALSTRSVDLNLARPFKAGKVRTKFSRRVATPESNVNSIVAMRREPLHHRIPALKRRAKFKPTLRVEDT